MAALSLSKQQWRTYRQSLPKLHAVTNRSACFSAGDLLATAVVQSVSVTLQMPVSALTPIANSLFEICGAHPWIHLERTGLALALEEGRVILLADGQRPRLSGVVLLIELTPLVFDLRERLLAAGSDPQGDLAFPPMAAGNRL